MFCWEGTICHSNFCFQIRSLTTRLTPLTKWAKRTAAILAPSLTLSAVGSDFLVSSENIWCFHLVCMIELWLNQFWLFVWLVFENVSGMAFMRHRCTFLPPSCWPSRVYCEKRILWVPFQTNPISFCHLGFSIWGLDQIVYKLIQVR